MMGRTFQKKRKTELAYGKRKRRPPTAPKSREVITDEPDSSNGGTWATLPGVSVPCGAPPSQPPSSDNDVALDPETSTSYSSVPDNSTELRRRSDLSSEDCFLDVSAHQREALRRDTQVISEVINGASADAFNQRSCAYVSCGGRRTIQEHIQPSFVSAETVQARRSAVRESLGAMSATERKFALTVQPECNTTPAPEDEFVVIQMSALNSLITNALCPLCQRPSLAVDRGTRLGLAAKMMLKCFCDFISSQWSVMLLRTSDLEQFLEH